MKKLLLLMTLLPFVTDAQQDKEEKEKTNWLKQVSADTNVKNMYSDIQNKIPKANDQKLVTSYSFHRLFGKDFAKILSADNSSNAGSMYASLSLDQDKSTFDFSPFTFDIGNYKSGNKLYATGNVYIKGQINSDEVATFFNSDGFNRNFTIGGNLKIVISKGSGNTYSANEPTKTYFRGQQNAIADELCEKYTTIVNTAKGDAILNANNIDILQKPTALRKKMKEEFSDMELKLADKLWTRITRQWINVKAEFGYTSTGTYDIYTKKAGSKEVINSNFGLGYNFFTKHIKSNLSVYFNQSVLLKRKNSFSDITAKSYNTINKIDDTTFFIYEKKDLYMYDSTTYKEAFTPATTTDLILMWENEKLPFGIHTGLNIDFPLIEKGTGSTPTKYSQTYGIIFPFNNKEGERTINIELFYSHQTFADKTATPGTELWGAKFAVPIFSKK